MKDIEISKEQTEKQKSAVTFYSGVGTVTGANFLLECANKRILIDCGLRQGDRFCNEDNRAPFPYDAKSMNFLFVTHAHMDHIGRIPKLVRDGFKGVIYSTPETKSLAELMFPDALLIMRHEWQKTAQQPMYGEEDISASLALWQTIPYHQEQQLTENLSVYLKDAGHILGSALIEFRHNETDQSGKSNKIKKIVFTGDSGNSPSLLLKDTEPITDADYLVLDSVYGDRNHQSKEDRRARFVAVLNQTIKRGGTLVIPAFSVERSQEILYELNNFIEHGIIQSIPVFFDSPLAIKVTSIYEKARADFNEKAAEAIKSGDDLFKFPKLKMTPHVRQSEHIDNTRGPKVIIAASGMSSGGRIINHERYYLPDPKSTILFVGYQAVGSLGRQISEGVKEVTIDGQKIEIKAQVESISGYSSHKDSDHLVEFAAGTASTVKRIFVVMGEPKSSLFLVQRLRDNLAVDAIMPQPGECYMLDL